MKAITGYGLRNDGTTTVRFGDNAGPEYIKIPKVGDELRIAHVTSRIHPICDDNDTYIKDIIVTFADREGLRVKEIYTCDIIH